jgi:hypothetical protein
MAVSAEKLGYLPCGQTERELYSGKFTLRNAIMESMISFTKSPPQLALFYDFAPC